MIYDWFVVFAIPAVNFKGNATIINVKEDTLITTWNVIWGVWGYSQSWNTKNDKTLTSKKILLEVEFDEKQGSKSLLKMPICFIVYH